MNLVVCCPRIVLTPGQVGEVYVCPLRILKNGGCAATVRRLLAAEGAEQGLSHIVNRKLVVRLDSLLHK